MVEAVVALAEGEEGGDEGVGWGVFVVVGGGAEPVGEGVDGECGLFSGSPGV